MDGQDSLEQSTSKLASRIQRYHKELVEAEDRATKQQPMSLETLAFKQIRRRISLFAIGKLQQQWKQLQTELHDIQDQVGDCNCDIRLRYSLPCKHDLLPCHLEQTLIPLSLLHPRWVLRGPPAPANWAPSYETVQKTLVISPKKSIIEQKLQLLDDLRSRVLQGDDARDFQTHIESELDNLIRRGQNADKFARLPQLLPETLKKRTRKTKKGTRKSRELTSREEQDSLRRKEKRAVQKQRRNETIITQRHYDELPASTAPPRLTAGQSPPSAPPAPHRRPLNAPSMPPLNAPQ
jgi:hypothetical protein